MGVREVASEQTLEEHEGKSPEGSVPGRGQGECKGPDAGLSLGFAELQEGQWSWSRDEGGSGTGGAVQPTGLTGQSWEAWYS